LKDSALQLDNAQKTESSVFDDLFVACCERHTMCPCGSDQETVRWIAARITRKEGAFGGRNRAPSARAHW
jgi:hypothetical protein